MIPLTQKIGDNKTYRIPLTWEGRPFRASEDWLLTFTLKVDPDTENDEDALIQKVTGAGILNAGNDALVSIVPIDTRGDAEADPVVAEIDPGSYYWGILAQNTDTGERRHVQLGKLKLEQAVTRDDETAIPIYTTNPPAYPISGSVRYDEEQTLTNPQKAQAKENIGIPIDNFTAVAAPTVNDDVTEGYSQGSKWYDSVGQEAYLCVNATNGAAVWIMTTLTADELGSAAFTDSTDYATAAQGDLADSSLQPVAVDYRGAYNNGDGTYAVGSVVLYNELLYIKISNPSNPGYPPGGADWELFEPEIGSPAYDLWVQTLLDSKANNQDLADYLPLAGGIMDDNATIGWDNAAAIREAGAQGLEIECSAGYRWQWVAGRMILRQINSEQIARIIAIDGINPSATDDITQGFVPNTRWETVDGTIYICTDATEDAAVWRRGYSGNSSVTTWHYRAKTTITTGNPTDAHVIWNNATQINATSINVSHKDQDGDDIEFFLGFIQEGQQLFLQDRDLSQNFQIWLISGTPTLTGGGTANAYYTFPVTLVDSGGTGTTGFANNHQLLFGTTQALALHAPTHAIGGSDPLTPADIGALTGADQAETEAATITDKAVVPAYLRIKLDGSAIVVGDLTGDARGGNALDVQAYRTSSTQIASGAGAIAVGRYNTVSGGDSIAVGFENTASGYYTTAFGYKNTASDFRSSAFGNGNDASGGLSSAFGYDNTASGGADSAFGYKNTASGYNSSAFGNNNSALGQNCVAFGNGNSTASGSYLDAASIGIGNSAIGTNSVAIGSSNTSNGSVSSAFGWGNTASGDNTVAFGKNNQSTNGYSTAVGNGNIASGNTSTAVGISNTASAIGTLAFGSANTTSATGASAFGAVNTVSGTGAFAFGGDNTASGTNSVAFGRSNTVGGSNSVSFGASNTASGGYAISIGRSNTANEGGCVSMGNSNSASGYYYPSIAVGISNNASGDSSSAIGSDNDATAANSSAIGRSNSASADSASAVGIDNTASGSSSSAFGSSCTASAAASSALGYIASASGNSALAIGHRAKTSIANTFEAGYWSNSTTRGGAVRIHPNGQVAKTIVNSATAPLDGGATAGSEADARLPRGMYAIQKSGTTVKLYFNNAGTIQSLTLGVLV